MPDHVSFWVAKLWEAIRILKPLPWELNTFTPIRACHQKPAPLSYGVLQAPVLFTFLNFPSQTNNLTTEDVLGAQACRFPTVMGWSHHRPPASQGCEPFDSTWYESNMVWPLSCIWSWPNWHEWIKIWNGLTCRAMCFDIFNLIFNLAPFLENHFFGGSFAAVLSATGQRWQQLRVPHEVADQHWGDCPKPSDCLKKLWWPSAKSIFCWGKLLVLFSLQARVVCRKYTCLLCT